MALLVSDVVAQFEDSWQPTGNTKWENWAIHVEMKKLKHKLVLRIDGPENTQAVVRGCMTQAAGAGLIAAVAAAFATGGAALPAATTAALGALANCLGNAYQVRFDDESNWETWWT
jgi:hypothetical protein